MWVTCAICERNYVDPEYLTDTRTYSICDKCYRAGYRIEERTLSTTAKQDTTYDESH